jgi:hypothetical protein
MEDEYNNIDEQNIPKRVPRNFMDFNYLYKPREQKDTLPNFLNFEITKRVNQILDKPASSVIIADPNKKVILAKLNDLIAFFLNYSTQLRAIYQKTKNPNLKALIERIIIKNDSYLNSALALYKSEASIYDIKDQQQGMFLLSQGQTPYNYQNINYGPQNKNSYQQQ